VFTELLSQHGELDVALVLISVADDERVTLALHGDDGVELRLGTGFKTEIELASVRDDLVDDRLHLVDFDGINDIALPLEIVLFLCLLVALSHLLNAIVENIGEAEQHRRGDIAQGKLVHDITQIDLRVVLARRDIDITLLVYSEIRSTPTINIVQLLGVVDGPFFHLIQRS
jgi:hypothetical protein